MATDAAAKARNIGAYMVGNECVELKGRNGRTRGMILSRALG
jgi:hypothetical protein